MASTTSSECAQSRAEARDDEAPAESVATVVT